MKHFKLYLAALLLLQLSCYAQITKGHWLVGGQGDFSYIKLDSKDANSEGYRDRLSSYRISLEPNIGYFFVDKFATGLKLRYQNVFSKRFPMRIDNSILSISPFFRILFFRNRKKLQLFY